MDYLECSSGTIRVEREEKRLSSAASQFVISSTRTSHSKLD